MRPQAKDHPEYYTTYVSYVKHDEVVEALINAKQEALTLLRSIPQNLENHAYAAGKWSIKQVFIHMMDTERVFAYRALCFARGEVQKMLSFDENVYAANSKPQQRSLKDIGEELEAVSNATIIMYRSFDKDTLAARGEMVAGPITVNALGYTISGHALHHLNVIRERYLK